MISIERSHLEIAAGTDPGMKGKNNEDQFSVSAYQLSATDPTPALFAIVADGIGGHRAGEVASKIAVEMVSDAVSHSDASHPVEIMKAAIIQASQSILTQAHKQLDQQGMGTTAVCTWIIDKKLYVTYVGNSRLYLLRGRRLHLMTNDHTWVQEAVNAGALTPEQARVHPNANIIRRYLGSEQRVEVDSRIRTDNSSTYSIENQGMRLKPGDRLLLCSDGLNDMVVDDKIGEILSQDDLNLVAANLIAEANLRGGKDNTTVIVIEVPGHRKKGGLRARLRGMKPQLAVAYAGLAVMVLAVLAALGIFLVEFFLK